MKTRLSIACATIFALLAAVFVFAPSAHAATGFYISNGRLYEAGGQEFVMRGVSHAHTWYTSQTSSFANIKSLGANSVRVVLSSGHRWTKNNAADVANVISLCKASKLICVLEVHDTTGYGEEGAAATLAQAVDYWIEVKSALVGQERYVLLNIGNEPFGNNATANANWVTHTSQAIQRLRSNGFDHTIVVDAPNWGQDWQFIMRDNASTVFAADPARNTLFSIHMYGVFNTAQKVTDYLSRFQTAGLPIMIGEFGFNHSDGDPDEDTIMAQSQSRRIGYIGWSWSGNGGGVEYLDMVTNFNVNSLTPWGQRIFNGANGISSTSVEAAVYGGIQPSPSISPSTSPSNPGDTQAPTTPGTPTASNVTQTSVNLAWTASTDNVGVTGYDVVRVQGTTETTVATSATNSASVTGLTAATQYSFAVYARDAAGNRSNRSATVSVTTQSGSGGGACTATYTITNSWPGGFQADVKITNGTTATTSWAVRWTFANGQTITQIWSGQDTPSGASHTVRNMSYNGSLASGGTTSFGFLATWNNTTNAVPTVTCAHT